MFQHCFFLWNSSLLHGWTRNPNEHVSSPSWWIQTSHFPGESQQAVGGACLDGKKGFSKVRVRMETQRGDQAELRNFSYFSVLMWSPSSRLVVCFSIMININIFTRFDLKSIEDSVVSSPSLLLDSDRGTCCVDLESNWPTKQTSRKPSHLPLSFFKDALDEDILIYPPWNYHI